MPSKPVKFPWHCLTHWIPKLSGHFEIHWVRQYSVTLKSNLYIGPVNIFPNFLHCDMTPYLLLKRGPDQQLKYKDRYEVQFFDQYTSPSQSCRRFMQTWNIAFMHLVEIWRQGHSQTISNCLINTNLSPQNRNLLYGSGHETAAVLNCYLVLLSFDSKTR